MPFIILLFIINIIIYYKYIYFCILHVNILIDFLLLLILCMSEFLVTGGQKCVLDLLGLELQLVMSHHMGAGIVPGSSGRTRLLAVEPLLPPQHGFIQRDRFKAHT